MNPTNTFGERLRQIRRERGYSQEGLAEISGITAGFIARMEQGRADPSVATVYKLAGALAVSPSLLLDRRERLEEAGRDRGILAVRNAILVPGDLPGLTLAADGPPAALENLDRTVGTGWELYWSGRFGLLANLLPSLINSARVTEQETGTAACKPLAQSYQLAADLLVHTGDDDLAYAAAVRAARAMERAEGTPHHDPLQQAVLTGTASWILLHMGRLADAQKVAEAGAEKIRPAGKAPLGHLCVYGAMLLSAAAPAAAAGKRDDVAAYMAEAQVTALPFTDGDRHDYEVSFGPSQVAMQKTHQMAVLGEPGEALRAVKRVNRGDLLQISWGALHLDVAQAALQAGRVTAAVKALWTAHDVSPEWVRHQGLFRTSVAGAVRAENRLSARTRKLAAAAGLRR